MPPTSLTPTDNDYEEYERESEPEPTKPKVALFPLLVFLFFSLVLIFLGYERYTNLKKISNLNTENQKLAINLENESKLRMKENSESNATINSLSEQIDNLNHQLDYTTSSLEEERERNSNFENQIDDLQSAVTGLNKLTKTDRELLMKYSRTYFLNENFIPSKLTQINQKYVLDGKKDQYLHGDALPFLEDLLKDAKRAGYDIRILSAYRSFDEQNELKGQFSQTYGSGANSFSADQGYSEHQLGTTVDIVDVKTGATSQSFANTDAYKWLVDNAYRYGFILSYPEDNQYYIFEPWHWRFVGIDLARDLHRLGDNFYDWDQRRIDEYLIKIFD